MRIADNPHIPACVSTARKQGVEGALGMQNSVAISVAEHGHHIESHIQTPVGMSNQVRPRRPDESPLLCPGYHPMPISLNGLGPRLDLHDDQPRSIPRDQVHLQLSDSPIARQHLPAPPHHVVQGHRFTPASKA